MSYFEALLYALAYLRVISALTCIDSLLPIPKPAPPTPSSTGLAGTRYVMHRESFAGTSRESRRMLDTPFGSL
ncbi:hypothetical protein AXF14_02070 [Actinomyces radicidentis]|uniref:Uncharacterized protein n=1 Tax=Actinomyces radicidentis TaxID=111015 RepID=A0A0X8JGD4_ACTRD|nr:hypothetical protein AXF14_02070 [Actinomyces radicidentis]